MAPIRNTRSEAFDHLRFLIYGAAGAGKTSAATTFPRFLVIDCEGGLLSVRGRGVDFVSCRSIAELRDAIETVRAHTTAYDTIVIDSLSEIARLALDEVMGASAALHTATLLDWSRMTLLVRRIVRTFSALPHHLVFTALAKELRDKDGRITGVRPGLPGRLGDEISGDVDFVLYLAANLPPAEWRTAPRMLLTSPDGCIFAKDRSGTLPLWIEPQWSVIENALHIGETTADDPAVKARTDSAIAA